MDKKEIFQKAFSFANQTVDNMYEQLESKLLQREKEVVLHAKNIFDISYAAYARD